MTVDVKKDIVKIALIALTIALILTQAVAPLLKSMGPAAGIQVQISERLARLEEGTRKLEAIPEKVSALTEATSGLKAAVDRLEKKIDDHVTRGK